MARRGLCALLCMLCWSLCLLKASSQSVNHHKPRDPPLGSLSRLNEATKHYEPVTSDSRYTYYRIKVSLNETFVDRFTPDPQKPSVVSVVISGDVFDNTTGVKVGAFDSSSISTVVDASNELQFLATLAIELGPNGDDTIFIMSALDRANFVNEPTDFELAVVGGTGRYKGATGEVFHTGMEVTKPGNIYVAEIAVPKFKRF